VSTVFVERAFILKGYFGIFIGEGSKVVEANGATVIIGVFDGISKVLETLNVVVLFLDFLVEVGDLSCHLTDLGCHFFHFCLVLVAFLTLHFGNFFTTVDFHVVIYLSFLALIFEKLDETGSESLICTFGLLFSVLFSCFLNQKIMINLLVIFKKI
jgi:hypothetical protein